jgi:hypothetical protein
MTRGICLLLVALLGWGVLFPQSSAGQLEDVPGPRRATSGTSVPALKTTVRFELLATQFGPDLSAHRWAELLDQAGASVTVRQPVGDDALGVTETVRGSLRWVTVVAELNADGQVIVPGRQFALSELGRLREWVDELKLYGAQGAPEGQPLWGMTPTQFEAVFNALSTPIAADPDGQPFATAVSQLGLPASLPLRFHSSVPQATSAARHPVRQRLSGMSCGTALAAVLSDEGLGYRPLRTPDGAIELVVQPIADIPDPWPVGWEPKEETTFRGNLAPALFQRIPVGFENVLLEDVLSGIAQVAETPIVIDRFAAQAAGVDLSTIRVSYPRKTAAWITVINAVVLSNRMRQQLRTDERGTAFVHVIPVVRRPAVP